jgi:hypothetical protein
MREDELGLFCEIKKSRGRWAEKTWWLEDGWADNRAQPDIKFDREGRAVQGMEASEEKRLLVRSEPRSTLICEGRELPFRVNQTGESQQECDDSRRKKRMSFSLCPFVNTAASLGRWAGRRFSWSEIHFSLRHKC